MKTTRHNGLSAPARENVSDLAALLGLPVFAPGSVWIAGAGPGDPGLVTLLGAHAIRQADVILYDALLNTALLKLAGAETELVFAGKRKGMPPTRQAEISARLVALAKENKRVLRLKGGDPFVFGRGGEEALALAQAGVPFRIVPGVTAGIGGLAYAGIPVTHRDTNHAVTFLTGHGSDGNLPPLDWSAISRARPRSCSTWHSHTPKRSRQSSRRRPLSTTNPPPSSATRHCPIKAYAR